MSIECSTASAALVRSIGRAVDDSVKPSICSRLPPVRNVHIERAYNYNFVAGVCRIWEVADDDCVDGREAGAYQTDANFSVASNCQRTQLLISRYLLSVG